MKKSKKLYPPVIGSITPCFLLLTWMTVTLLLVSTITLAAVITVNSDPVGPGCTIIDAINSANADSAMGGCAPVTTGIFGGDTIILPADLNIHTLFAVNNTVDGPNGLPSITSNITIEGNHGIIQRLAVSSTPKFRLFHVAAGDALTLNNLTLRKGVADDGNPSSVTPTDNGAAIYNKGSVTLNSCTIAENNADQSAIYNLGSMKISRSLLRDNTNGAVTNIGGDLTIRDSTIADNRPISGGVTNTGGGNVQISRSTLTANVAGFGGAIWNAASMTIQDSTISGNRSFNAGGGIEATGTETTTLINVTVSDNTARDGGGIYHSFGTLNLVNTLVIGNHLFPTGGSGVEILRKPGSASAGNQHNNLLGHDGITNARAFAGFAVAASDITATSDGTMPSPLTKIIGSLGNNGGPTMTHALPSGSPAINAAVTTYSTGSLLFGEGCATTIFFPSSQTIFRNDQRDIARPQKKTCDIGAYERREKSFYVIPLSGGKAVVFEL